VVFSFCKHSILFLWARWPCVLRIHAAGCSSCAPGATAVLTSTLQHHAAVRGLSREETEYVHEILNHNLWALVCAFTSDQSLTFLRAQDEEYRGADKSLARPGREQARKHVRDARDFNNMETRAVIKSPPPPPRQGAEGNSRHSDRNISLFPSWSGTGLISIPVYTDITFVMRFLSFNLLLDGIR